MISLPYDVCTYGIFNHLKWIDKIHLTCVNRSIHGLLNHEITWEKIEAAEIKVFEEKKKCGHSVTDLYTYADEHVNKKSFKACLALEKGLGLYWNLRIKQKKIIKAHFINFNPKKPPESLIENAIEIINRINFYEQKPYALRVLRAVYEALQQYINFPGIRITKGDERHINRIITEFFVEKLEAIAEKTTKIAQFIQVFILAKKIFAMHTSPRTKKNLEAAWVRKMMDVKQLTE